MAGFSGLLLELAGWRKIAKSSEKARALAGLKRSEKGRKGQTRVGVVLFCAYMCKFGGLSSRGGFGRESERAGRWPFAPMDRTGRVLSAAVQINPYFPTFSGLSSGLKKAKES